jgi:hypothetical protein
MEEYEILEELIDRYLSGSMAEEELNSFNSRLSTDPDLRKEVELQRSIIEAVRKEQLERIIRNEEKKINNTRKLILYAGSLAIAASLIGVFFVGNQNTCENIANSYYSSYIYTPIPSRGGENLPLTKSDSVFFDAIGQLKIESPIRYFNEGSPKLDIEKLESINNPSSEMIAATQDAVKWYLSLAYLQKGKKRKARNLLEELVKMQDNEYASKANELLKEL